VQKIYCRKDYSRCISLAKLNHFRWVQCDEVTELIAVNEEAECSEEGGTRIIRPASDKVAYDLRQGRCADLCCIGSVNVLSDGEDSGVPVSLLWYSECSVDDEANGIDEDRRGSEGENVREEAEDASVCEFLTSVERQIEKPRGETGEEDLVRGV
jgi:hypothetical protein